MKNKSKIVNITKQFFKFGIVGTINTLNSWLVYYILIFFKINYLISNTIAYFASSLIGYFLNKIWVFKKKDQNTSKSLVKYYIVYITSYFLNMLCMYTIVDILNISEKLAPILVLFITVPFNFIFSKLWIFNQKPSLSKKELEKIAKEKYYMGIATITNTKTDIDKLYDQLETTDEVLTNGSLIDSLNNLHGKTFAENSVVTIIENYNDAISDNFTEEYINNNILSPNGFVANINNEYYMYKDKLDNYFFKEAEFKVLSKNEQEMIFEVQNINYAASCASEGNPMPSLTCSDTKKSEKSEFKIVKEGSKWKIAQMVIKTA